MHWLNAECLKDHDHDDQDNHGDYDNLDDHDNSGAKDKIDDQDNHVGDHLTMYGIPVPIQVFSMPKCSELIPM